MVTVFDKREIHALLDGVAVGTQAWRANWH